MRPLYDKDIKLVGWLDGDGNLFDLHMEWVAYVIDGHAWSPDTDAWLGPVDGTTCLDHRGCVVAWNPDQAPDGTPWPTRPERPETPESPLRPERPLIEERPLRPERPLQGWSEASFLEWLTQE